MHNDETSRTVKVTVPVELHPADYDAVLSAVRHSRMPEPELIALAIHIGVRQILQAKSQLLTYG